jgi:phage terminase small subunit
VALTDKQRVFCSEYVIDFNASQAAIRSGYSEKTAGAIGWENLKKPEIDQEIKRLIDERCMRSDEVLMRLAGHARGDIGDVLTDDGEGIDWQKAKRARKTHLVKKVTIRTERRTIGDDKEVETETRSIELYDAQGALVQIGRHHKLFVDKSELVGKDDQPLIPLVRAQPGEYDKLK